MAAVYTVSGTVNGSLGPIGGTNGQAGVIALSNVRGMAMGITIVNGGTNALGSFELDIKTGDPSVTPWVNFISGTNWTNAAMPNNVFWASGTPASLGSTATASAHIRVPPSSLIRFQAASVTTGGGNTSLNVFVMQDLD